MELKDLRSEPVGYMDVKEMHPLDFEEFILGIGVNAQVIDALHDAWINHTIVDDLIHSKMLELFRLYLVIGGMPAAVNEYIESNNLQNVMSVQKGIINMYKRDIAKYDPNAIAVLLLDQRMPGGMTGTEVQDHLIARKATIPIVFLTGHGDVPIAVSALKKGAADFLQKPVKIEILLPLIAKLLNEARENRMQSERQSLNEAMLSKLTPREQQVLERIVAGRLNKQIADDLGISIKTVEAHRASIMDKTNSGTVADLMRVVLGAAGQGH